MKHVKILIYIIVILIQSSCKVLDKSNFKTINIYDYNHNLMIKNFYKDDGMYSKSLWYTEKGDKYPFEFSKNTKIFQNREIYYQFLKENHKDTSLNFRGKYYIWFLVSKKGRIIEGRITKKTKGCSECDKLAVETMWKIAKKTSFRYDKNNNSIVMIIIPFGHLYE